MAEKRIVVTGGAGFIGSHFLRHLLDKYDANVVLVDKFTYAGNPDNFADFKTDPRFHMVIGDVAAKWSLRHMEAWGPVTHIVNFAAESFVDSSIHSDQSAFVHSNIQGTLSLLQYVREHPEIRYVQVSTDEVYGDLSLDERRRFREGDPVSPNNPYSASKAAADHMVMAYRHTYGINASITRCSNNYGSHQFPEKFIPRMIIQALKDEALPVYGKGENVRDWIHVTDHCRAIDVVLHEGQPGAVYNVGGDAEFQNIEVAKRILDILGKPHSLIEYVEDRPGHDRRYAVDSSRMQVSFGWIPLVGFEKGLEETVRWYAENPKWISRIETGKYRHGISSNHRAASGAEQRA